MSRLYAILALLLLMTVPGTAQEIPRVAQIALDDLNLRLDTDLTLFTPDFIWRWEERTFDDLTAGCRDLDTSYDPYGISGYVLTYLVGGRTYRYHTSIDGDIIIACGDIAPAVTNVPRPVSDAVADLSSRVGFRLTPNQIPWRWREAEFDDVGLGCPLDDPTVEYEPPKVRGYVIELTLQGEVYEYRVSTDRQILIYCNPRLEDEDEASDDTSG